jgi:formylglycine-generating enzyme required for sulfatase activity
MKTLLAVSFALLPGLIYIPAHAEQVALDPLLDLKFVTIPAGQFIMGTENLDEAQAELPDPKTAMIDDELPAHRVLFEKPFRLSQTEVTQKSWLAIMGTKPGPDSHWSAKNWQQLPVVSVSWNRATEFIDKLNRLSSDVHYRLPTEAEWEYAARAGNSGLRPFSKLSMDEYAWYINSSNDEIQAVAKLEANAWGLYDMYGNVWEWVADWYSPTAYTESARNNPQGPEKGNKKVRRGGSYHCPPHLIRSAYRAADDPKKSYSVLGFRLVAEEK